MCVMETERFEELMFFVLLFCSSFRNGERKVSTLCFLKDPTNKKIDLLGPGLEKDQTKGQLKGRKVGFGPARNPSSKLSVSAQSSERTGIGKRFEQKTPVEK